MGGFQTFSVRGYCQRRVAVPVVHRVIFDEKAVPGQSDSGFERTCDCAEDESELLIGGVVRFGNKVVMICCVAISTYSLCHYCPTFRNDITGQHLRK